MVAIAKGGGLVRMGARYRRFRWDVNACPAVQDGATRRTDPPEADPGQLARSL